jgi:hypothetical protein
MRRHLTKEQSDQRRKERERIQREYHAYLDTIAPLSRKELLLLSFDGTLPTHRKPNQTILRKIL